MDGGHLCDLFNHQVLPPILGAVQQLIKLLCSHFPVETAKRAFDSALDDDLLLVRHKANAEASILPKRPQRIIPQQPLHSYPRGAETYAEGRRSATQAKFAIEEAVTLARRAGARARLTRGEALQKSNAARAPGKPSRPRPRTAPTRGG